MLENFIFDLDGTVINSAEEILLCLKKALKEADCAIDEKKLNSDIIGPPLKQIIASVAPEIKDEALINEIVRNYRKIYDYDENDISVLYDGVYEFIKNLNKNGKKVFIATFKPMVPTMRIVKMYGLLDILTDVYGPDKYETPMNKEDMINAIVSKYGLNKNETIITGDAASDINAGKNAGVVTAGALWGYGKDKVFLKTNSDYAFDNIEQMRSLL